MLFKNFWIKNILQFVNKTKILFNIYLLLLVLKIFDLFFFYMFNLNIVDYSITKLNVIPDGNPSDVHSDPVRCWPSGVPQSISVIGTGLAVFTALSKVSNCTPRMRVLSALGAAGVTSTQIVYHSAIENSVGFNRFMFGWTIYKETGVWPSIDEISRRTSNSNTEEWSQTAIKNADSNIVNNTVEEVKNILDKSSKFLPDNYDELVNKFLDTIFSSVTSILKPVEVQGYFDDLIGQQIIIHIILFVLVISIIFLYLFLIINITLILNKDRILNKFNNKYIKYYIKYQTFLAKLSLIYVPILMLSGLLVLTHGLYFLITHQIPYESLNMDLHFYTSSKK